MLIGAPILSAQSKKEYNPEVIDLGNRDPRE